MSPHFLRPDWPAHGAVHALMSYRHGGGSSGAYRSNNLGVNTDDLQAEHNRACLKGDLSLPSEPLWLQQVHGSECLYAVDLPQRTQADAVWTDKPGQVLSIQTADCLPVLFADKQGSVVAAAHAGWRGLVGGVLENTLQALPVPASKVDCWLGVAIGPCCFEVGPEVRDAFILHDKRLEAAFTASKYGKWMADLYLLARHRLLEAGVASVSGGTGCSGCDEEDFFSYRRDGGKTGRMASLIWLES